MANTFQSGYDVTCNSVINNGILSGTLTVVDGLVTADESIIQ